MPVCRPSRQPRKPKKGYTLDTRSCQLTEDELQALHSAFGRAKLEKPRITSLWMLLKTVRLAAYLGGLVCLNLNLGDHHAAVAYFSQFSLLARYQKHTNRHRQILEVIPNFHFHFHFRALGSSDFGSGLPLPGSTSSAHEKFPAEYILGKHARFFLDEPIVRGLPRRICCEIHAC